MHLVFECAPLQMLRDDMPTLFRVRKMRCFVWQDNIVLMSRFVRDAMRMVRAASSGNELDVYSAKLAGTDVTIFFFIAKSHSTETTCAQSGLGPSFSLPSARQKRVGDVAGCSWIHGAEHAAGH